MGIRDWLNKADALEVKHKGTPVLSHQTVISAQESEWQEEKQEDERGKLAYKSINELFSSFDEEEEDE